MDLMTGIGVQLIQQNPFFGVQLVVLIYILDLLIGNNR